MKIKFDEDTCICEVYKIRDNNQRYKDALEKFKNATAESNNRLAILDSAVCMETVAVDVTYKKGFHDGMRFILDTIAGKEVIDL